LSWRNYPTPSLNALLPVQEANRAITKFGLYKFALEAFSEFSRDPTIPREAIGSMARLMGEFGIVDRAAVANAPTEAFYDNSYVDEIKQSGFLRKLWK